MEEREISSSEGGPNEDRRLVFTVDSFANGIAFGQQTLPVDEDPRELFALRLKDSAEVVPLRSRYALHRDQPLVELERHLMRLSRQGVLRASTIYFGTSTDPFFPFEGKFDASMRFLELFQRYTPGMLHVQTRSPLIVIALPVLTKLGRHCSVTLGLETPDEDTLQHYVPGAPRVAERLKTARALRRFGIEVHIQVNPILPYGDWRKDAKGFAELLVEHADSIHLGSLTDGSAVMEKKLRTMKCAKKLAEDRRFHWLRPDAHRMVEAELERIAPEKLRLPVRPHMKDSQLDIFAA